MVAIVIRQLTDELTDGLLDISVPINTERAVEVEGGILPRLQKAVPRNHLGHGAPLGRHATAQCHTHARYDEVRTGR